LKALVQSDEAYWVFSLNQLQRDVTGDRKCQWWRLWYVCGRKKWGLIIEYIAESTFTLDVFTIIYNLC